MGILKPDLESSVKYKLLRVKSGNNYNAPPPLTKDTWLKKYQLYFGRHFFINEQVPSALEF